MSETQMPAGWYRDPAGLTQELRYWDGERWVGQPQRPEGAPPPLATPQTNSLAVASLVLGIIGPFLCGVGSVVGFVLGLVALDQIKKSEGWQTGRGSAVAGVILGGIVTALIAGWVVLMAAGMAMGGGSS